MVSHGTSDQGRAPGSLERRVVAICAGAFVLAAAASWPVTSALFDTANQAPSALAALRDAADPRPATRPPPGATRSLAVLLLDGLRLDEARRLPALRSLETRAAFAVDRVPLPALSRPFYHTLLTGVPQAGSGVRTNRYAGPARFDSLADRVRGAGGSVAVVADRIDWLARMHAGPRDFTHVGLPGFVGALDRALDRAATAVPGLVLVQFTGVDHTAHQSGTRAPAHRRALRDAGALLARLDRDTASRGMALAVLSDHGHIGVGGHGGPERVVRRVPFVLRAGGLAPGRRPLLVAPALAPILAHAMGVPPPRSAIATVPAAWGDGASPASRKGARLRAALVRDGARAAHARLVARRAWLVPLVLLLALGALGAIKRGLGGLDAGILVAPATFVALVWLGHRVLFDRPFTLSAIDEVGRHGERLSLLGGLAAAVAIEVGAFVPWLVARRRTRARGAPPLRRVRRAAAATGSLAVAAMLAALAWVGCSLGAWPLSPHAWYLPVLAFGCGAGACLAASAALALSLAVPVVLARLTAPRARPPTSSGGAGTAASPKAGTGTAGRS